VKKACFALLVLLPLLGFASSLGQTQDIAVMSVPPEFPNRPFIFFLDESRDYRGELFLAYGDGQAPISLSLGLPVSWDLGWSPDGRWISFIPIEVLSDSSYDTLGNYVFDFVGAEILRVDDEFVMQAVPYDFFGWSTRWADANLLSFSSDDNSSFYFLNMLSKTYRTWQMPLHGNRSLHTNSVMMIDETTWLYSNVYDTPANKWGNSLEIAIWDDQSQSARILLENGPSTEQFPVLSPNRQQIAYTYVEGDSPRVAVMNIDGTNQQVVFAFDDDEAAELANSEYFYATRILTDLSWSPDSQSLTFLALNRIYTVRADGSELTEVGAGYGDVAWLSNELLYDHTGPSYIQTDGTVLEPVRYGDTPVRRIIILPDTADDYFVMRIDYIMANGFHSPIEYATPSPVTIGCEGAPPSRIQVVTDGTVYNVSTASALVNLNVHRGIGGETLGTLSPGSVFSIVGGPVCWNGMMWWQIESADTGLAGWVAEGAAPSDYYIAPQE
jgi:hypothetical protein